AEFALQSAPGGGGEELADCRPEKQVANRIAGDKRCAAPRTADLELEARSKVTRVQVLLRERPGLVNARGADCNPLEQRRGIQVEVFAEKVLIHLDRGFCIATNRKRDSRVQDQV